MRIDEIKQKLLSLKKKKIVISVDMGRNKMEELTGYVDEVYNNVWTFKTLSTLKCFSYSDILIKNVIISSL